MRQTRDILESGERPGVLVVMNELGVYNNQKFQRSDRGVFAGGHLLYVKSMRGMLPWIAGHPEFTLRDLDDALKSAASWGCRRHRVMRSAYQFIVKEKACESAA